MMALSAVDRGDLARRGQQGYDQHRRTKLEPEHNGEYPFLDVDQLAAVRRARPTRPGTVFDIVRVGYPAVGHIGARMRGRPSCIAGRVTSDREAVVGIGIEPADGQAETAEVEGGALVGLALRQGSRLTMDIVPDGPLQIEAIRHV